MRRFILGWKKAGLEQRLGARIVNYADDLVICCKGDSAAKALNSMRQMIGRLKLTVNEEKTRICRVPDAEFRFPGVHLWSALFCQDRAAVYSHSSIAEEY